MLVRDNASRLASRPLTDIGTSFLRFLRFMFFKKGRLCIAVASVQNSSCLVHKDGRNHKCSRLFKQAS